MRGRRSRFAQSALVRLAIGLRQRRAPHPPIRGISPAVAPPLEGSVQDHVGAQRAPVPHIHAAEARGRRDGGKGTVRVERGAGHDPGHGPRVGRIEAFHAHLHVEVAGLEAVVHRAGIFLAIEARAARRHLHPVRGIRHRPRERRRADVLQGVLARGERPLRAGQDRVGRGRPVEKVAHGQRVHIVEHERRNRQDRGPKIRIQDRRQNRDARKNLVVRKIRRPGRLHRLREHRADLRRADVIHARERRPVRIGQDGQRGDGARDGPERVREDAPELGVRVRQRHDGDNIIRLRSRRDVAAAALPLAGHRIQVAHADTKTGGLALGHREIVGLI